MKKILFIYGFLCFHFVFCQKMSEMKIAYEPGYVIYDSIQIGTTDKLSLTLSVVLSSKNLKPEGAILINTIYSDIRNINEAKKWADNGYAGIILNTRGKYLSSANIEPFEHEADDIYEAIDWIIKQPWSNGKVGMIGGSYLAFSQWAATKKLHPALKTIVPQAAVGVGTMDFPMRNHIFFNYPLQWLSRVTNNKMTDDKDFNNVNKWNAVFKSWYQSGKSFRKLDSISGKPSPVFQRWLDHPGFDEYWQKMIPYKNELSKINIPILTTTGYFDADQSGALYYFKEHHQYHKNAEHYLIIGPYDHQGAQGSIKNSLRGYTIDASAKIDLNTIWLEWFDYILKGKEKPSILKGKINYQVMGTNEWKNIGLMEELEKNRIRFYLGNKLLSTSKTSDNNFSTLKVDLKDRSDADELLSLQYNILDDFIYNKNNLVFTSEPFEKPSELSGSFSGKLKVAINKKDVDLYISLYEQTSNGKYFLLSSYVTRASYAKNNKQRNLLIPGKKETISIHNSEFVSKRIEKGSRLIIMTGVVKSPFWQINYGTGKDVSDETIADATEPLEIKWYTDSYIEIPIVQK